MENQKFDGNGLSQGLSSDEAEINYSTENENDKIITESDFIKKGFDKNDQSEFSDKKSQKKSKKKIILGLAVFVILILIIGGGVLGYVQYDKYFSETELEEVLPGDVDLVVQLTIDPESNQFKNLESNLQKFPGYDILKKELDEAGEGKTLSEVIQDGLKKKNLDFQNDIKPVLGSSAYLIVPSLNNLTDGIQENIKVSSKNLFNEFDYKNLDENKIALEGVQRDGNKPRILGQTKELYVNQGNEAISIEATDFIIASRINDLKKAKEVLKKIEGDGRYEFLKNKHQGYQYYQINLKEDNDESDQYFNYRKTYHALLGGNWIMSSSEDDVKMMIDKKSQLDLFGKFKSVKNGFSLVENDDYQKVKSNLKSEGDDVLFSVYFRIKELMRDNELNSFMKYPENVVGGFSLDIEEDGFLFKGASNNMNVRNLENLPNNQSLAYMVPQKIDQKWTDGFLEYGNPKDLYYNFKKNNVTSEGLEDWNNSLDEIKNSLGLDLERDFIDLIDGRLAFLLLTGENVIPSGALVLEVSDSEKMVNTMKKVVETVKLVQMGYIAETIEYVDDLEMKKQYEQKMLDIQESQIEEKEISGGLVYSYILPMEEIEGITGAPLGISFSAQNNKFVLGHDIGVVEKITEELQNSSVENLANNNIYKEGTKHYHLDNYTNSYVNTVGIWNIVQYVFGQIKNVERSFQQEMCGDPEFQSMQPQVCMEGIAVNNEVDDNFFAAGAVLRTLKSVATSSSVKEGFVGSSVFLKIEELPAKEKDRANRILELM